MQKQFHKQIVEVFQWTTSGGGSVLIFNIINIMGFWYYYRPTGCCWTSATIPGHKSLLGSQLKNIWFVLSRCSRETNQWVWPARMIWVPWWVLCPCMEQSLKFVGLWQHSPPRPVPRRAPCYHLASKSNLTHQIMTHIHSEFMRTILQSMSTWTKSRSRTQDPALPCSSLADTSRYHTGRPPKRYTTSHRRCIGWH